MAAKKKKNNNTTLILLGLGAVFLFMNSNNSGGNQAPPDERWWDVPGYGLTPQSMLESVGYTYMQEAGGFVSVQTLQDNGWFFANGKWDLNYPPNAGDYLALAGGVLSAVGSMFPTS